MTANDLTDHDACDTDDRDDRDDTVASLRALVEEQRALLDAQAARVARLEARLDGSERDGSTERITEADHAATERPVDGDESNDSSITRRALLGLAGAGAAAAATVATASPAAAGTQGEAMELGLSNTATGTTTLTSSSTGDGLAVLSTNTDGSFGALYTYSATGTSGLFSQTNGGRSVVAQQDGDGKAGDFRVEPLDATSTTLTAINRGLGRVIDISSLNVENSVPTFVATNVGSGVAVEAESQFGAPLRLVPADSDRGLGAPTSGIAATGSLYVDFAGSLFLCVAGGSPGTWRKLSNPGTTLLDEPARATDSRANASPGPKGRYAADETKVIDLAPFVPEGTTSIDFAFFAVSNTGDGFAAVYTADGPELDPPGFATALWSKKNTLNGASGSTRVSADRKVRIYVSSATHVILDVTAFNA